MPISICQVYVRGCSLISKCSRPTMLFVQCVCFWTLISGRPCVDCHAFEFMQRALQDLKKTAFNLDARVRITHQPYNPIPLSMCEAVFSFVHAIVNIYLKSQATWFGLCDIRVTYFSLDCSFIHWGMTLLSFDLFWMYYSYFLSLPRRRLWFWEQRGGHCVTACPPTLSAEPDYSPIFICVFMNLLVQPYSLCVCEHYIPRLLLYPTTHVFICTFTFKLS